jgi:hypothetical protein
MAAAPASSAADLTGAAGAAGAGRIVTGVAAAGVARPAPSATRAAAFPGGQSARAPSAVAGAALCCTSPRDSVYERTGASSTTASA